MRRINKRLRLDVGRSINALLNENDTFAAADEVDDIAIDTLPWRNRKEVMAARRLAMEAQTGLRALAADCAGKPNERLASTVGVITSVLLFGILILVLPAAIAFSLVMIGWAGAVPLARKTLDAWVRHRLRGGAVPLSEESIQALDLAGRTHHKMATFETDDEALRRWLRLSMLWLEIYSARIKADDIASSYARALQAADNPTIPAELSLLRRHVSYLSVCANLIDGFRSQHEPPPTPTSGTPADEQKPTPAKAEP